MIFQLRVRIIGLDEVKDAINVDISFNNMRYTKPSDLVYKVLGLNEWKIRKMSTTFPHGLMVRISVNSHSKKINGVIYGAHILGKSGI